MRDWQRLKFRGDNFDFFETKIGAFDLFILNERHIGDLDDVCYTMLSISDC